ncbi:acyl-CoA dehydrogenase [Nocardiopsis ansamitocini]|uniref:Acyl-CoA dehydrogenase YdbM n=1 Tax=Nocardiopsis ansamitocini TaxID=1670832 RepID=A0A9W6P7P9_9ACTN|nr:acyl-CoA dehydrogenase [Nocardiopsis ansamitocini]GLU48705.1 putative acyl-CoA dehydrogenase YdbM [Nocardiopsis ansamitocini]
MPTPTARPTAPAGTGAPVTPEGKALLALIDGVLPQIRDSAQHNDHHGSFPFDTFDTFRRNGVMGATVPAQLGGLGVGLLGDVALALLAVAHADASTALALHVQFSRGLTLAYEWRHGTAPARMAAERLLRSMATGEAVVCGAVKDHPSAVTRLVPDGSGGWLLSGRKTLVTLAPIGTHFVIHAQRQVEGEPTALAAPVLTRDTPGFSVIDTWDGLGMRASGTVDVAFDRCPVPDERVVVRTAVGARDDAVLAGQTVSSITMLGIYVGVAQAARDIAVAECRGRRAHPPAAVRTLVAEIEARLYALRVTAASALAEADAVAEGIVDDPAERGRRMMTPFQCAKMTVNHMALAIVNDCLTVVGGAAYSGGHPLARLYRDVRAGWFMQPYTYVDGVDYLSGQALGLDHDNDYVSARASRPVGERSVPATARRSNPRDAAPSGRLQP